MLCMMRIRYGTKIVEEQAELSGSTPARALRSAENLMLRRNEGLSEKSKKRAILLSIRPLEPYLQKVVY